MGSTASWACSSALQCAASCPALGPAGRGPPCQGPWHLRGTPCHIRALGTCGTGLRRCRCASCAVVLTPAGVLSTLVLSSLVPPRVAATWPVPPLCQGPRHLQEGAHVPAWGVFALSRIRALSGPSAPEASRGVGVRAPSQPGQSCGRWSPRQMRPVARMRLHVRSCPGSARASSCYRTGSLSDRWPLVCYCPWKIVRLGGLTFPFAPRLAPGLPLALGLVLALLGWCVVHG